MSSVQPPESASRAGRLDRILRDLVQQTPGVEAAAVVSFDGLPMASALPADMDEDRVAAMSAALLSLAERAAQGLGRGMLSQVYIEGEDGTVFLVSAQDEGVLIAVTSAGAKVGMMLYEVKLAANKVGEVLQAPAPAQLGPSAEEIRGSLEHQRAEPAPAPMAPVSPAAPAAHAHPTTYAEAVAAYAEPAYAEPAYAEPGYAEPGYAEPAYAEPGYAEPTYAVPAPAEPAHGQATYAEPNYYAESTNGLPATSEQPNPDDEQAQPEPADAISPPSTWSSYAPTGSVLPGEQGSWS